MARPAAQLHAFADFLLAYAHTLLCLRALYPPASFTRARLHNTPVYHSRHPQVCEWLRDAVAAIHAELVAGTVARVGIVVYGHDAGTRTGSPRVLERYMFDVAAFPVLGAAERRRVSAWEPHAAAADMEPTSRVVVDMAEQFRAALVLLNTRCAQLAPLPAGCPFNICMELRDDPGVDPPIRHPQPWIPVAPSVHVNSGSEVKVTPVRTVDAGVLRFETWIEESRAKSL